MPETAVLTEQAVNFMPGQTTVIAVTCEFRPNGYTDGRHQEVYDEWKHCVKEWLEKNPCMKKHYEGSLYLLDKTPPHGQFFLQYVFRDAEAAKEYSISDIFEKMVNTFAGEFKVVSNAVSVYQSGEVPGGG